MVAMLIVSEPVGPPLPNINRPADPQRHNRKAEPFPKKTSLSPIRIRNSQNELNPSLPAGPPHRPISKRNE